MRADGISGIQPIRSVQNSIIKQQHLLPQEKRSQGPGINSEGKQQAQKSVKEPELIDAIIEANKAFAGVERRFEISVHKETNTIMVKVINRESDEVIREIPPEKFLDMVARMWEVIGIFVDKRI